MYTERYSFYKLIFTAPCAYFLLPCSPQILQGQCPLVLIPHSIGTVTVMRGIFNALSVHLGVCTNNNQRGLYPSMYASALGRRRHRPSGCQSMERCNGNVERKTERRRTRGADKFTFEKNFMGIGQLHSAKRRRSGFGERR